MPTLWRWYVHLVILATLHRGEPQVARGCPPQEAILPCRCLTRGLEIQVWCSHSNLPKVLEGLRSVGQYLQEPIDELILENNHLPSLPGKTFIPLRVMRLMLRYNGLERVSTGWLSGLETTLMELFLVEPELRSLPEDSLDRMGALEAITIQSNLMKRLPKFSALPKLRHLQIESMSLVELSSRHFKILPVLEKLHVVGSPRLTRLEGGILQDLPRLSLVNISFCGISWIHPRAITHLPALTELWLVGNKITDAAIVGRSIRDLPALEVLRLDYNYMDKLSEAAFVDLPSLKKLYVSNNKIQELHHGAFHRVPKLRMLDLNRNMVRRVHPESFLQHSGSGLEELWLVENDISHVAELRSLLDALPRLIFLEMSHNNLEAIPFGALRGHATLERLHLDHNKIHIVEREAFMAMPALRELRLKNNSLSDVLGGPLWNLPALKGLDLSENYFRRIDPRLLANLPSLRRLDLSENELTLIDPASFLGTPSLEHINVSHNMLASVHPATFRHLLNLFEVDLSDNRMVEFVPGLPRGIEHVHISRNQVSNLPPFSSPDLDLPSLRMLDLTENRISNIPSGTLRPLPKLKKLYMGQNSLQQLEDGSLDGLSVLEILDLHDNKLTQIHPNALKDTTELRELKLGENRLTILRPEIFHGISRLKKLDVSRNQLMEILPGSLDNTRDIQIIDASHNSLVALPPSLHGMKHLRIIDVTNNRLKNINADTLSSLSSLSELRMSHNLLQELKRGAFDNLLHLKMLHLDNNELEIVEPHAFHSLPSLRALKLNRNKIRDIPDHAFNNLPSLQIAELQENKLKSIANNAFFEVPHLLMLNLSNNQIPGLDDAGLKSLRSLEMLDLSRNRLARVAGGNLEKMEWLVELRMDNNQICSVHGSPFNGMPRLRVLSIRNNKMMSFPEHSIQRLRGNLAVLDINGNPLACSCDILWFRAWLQESSTVGPKCNDGTLLREMRLSRQECSQENNQPEPVAPGCEAELLSTPDIYSTSQVFSPWMNLKDNASIANHGNKLAPSPEESDYFYDEYVDYPYNETLVASSLLANGNYSGNETVFLRPESQTLKSPHYISGDTPTIYAAASKNKSKPFVPTVPKGAVNSSPSTSGFTFFGVPLPNLNLNLNNLWSRGSGRMTEGQVTPDQQTAERKTAIVNAPPVIHPGHVSRFPPTMPQIETGGFIPLLPGSGGFKPIPNPQLKQEVVVSIETEKVEVSPATWPVSSSTEASVVKISPPTTVKHSEDNLKSSSTAGLTVPAPTLPIPTVPILRKKVELESNKTHVLTKLKIEPSVNGKPTIPTQTMRSTTKPVENNRQIANTTISEKNIETRNSSHPPDTEFVTFVPNLEQSSASDRFEDIFKEFVDNVSIPNIITSTENPIKQQTITTKLTTEKPTQLPTLGKILINHEVPKEEVTSTPLSALLAPTGQQQYRPQGRPIITRVQSPHVSGSAPLLSDLEISQDDEPLPLTHTREAKTSHIDGTTTQRIDTSNQDMSWYYINYNKTNLEPYIGPGGNFIGNACSKLCSFSNFMIFLSITYIFVI